MLRKFTLYGATLAVLLNSVSAADDENDAPEVETPVKAAPVDATDATEAAAKTADDEEEDDGEDLSDLEPDEKAEGSGGVGNVADNLKNAASDGMNEKLASELKELIDGVGDDVQNPEVWAKLREKFSPELKDAMEVMM